MVKFLHTADWQLGMTRYFFSEGAQEKYNQARFDAIRAMGRIAKEEGCSFMLVCGDAFESNQVDRKTVMRALEAIKDVPVPVFMLPGNHDPLNAASVYRSSSFEKKPANLQIIETSTPINIRGEVEIIGAPWVSKKPAYNPLEELLAMLEPAACVTRIIAAHGIVDQFTPDRDAPGVMAVEMLDQAIADRKADFIALGDRHSLTEVGNSGRIWYSGTPEATEYSEVRSGCANIVEIDGKNISTRAVAVGTWQFIDKGRFDLNTADEAESLQAFLNGIENKERTVLCISCVGSISLSLWERLQEDFNTATDLLAVLDIREDDLMVVPDDSDFKDLGFSGFADAAVKRLREQVTGGGENTSVSRDALMLLMRLAGGNA